MFWVTLVPQRTDEGSVIIEIFRTAVEDCRISVDFTSMLIIIQVSNELRGESRSFTIGNNVGDDAATYLLLSFFVDVNFGDGEDPEGLEADDLTFVVLAFADVGFINNDFLKLQIV